MDGIGFYVLTFPALKKNRNGINGRTRPNIFLRGIIFAHRFPLLHEQNTEYNSQTCENPRYFFWPAITALIIATILVLPGGRISKTVLARQPSH